MKNKLFKMISLFMAVVMVTTIIPIGTYANDSKESYLATFDKGTNTYKFENIARLITRMAKEKQEGTATENWNKVLIIPVEPTKDSSGKIVKLNHDFSMNSARLVGGQGNPLKLEVVYTNYK